METAFLGLGSNIGNREEYLKLAVEKIGERAGTIISVSPVYETAPWGFHVDKDFLNAVVRVETACTPKALLTELLVIEEELGRKRPGRGYSSRTIDLDLLLYSDSIISEDGLNLPHPHLHERRFVLAPLADLAPRLVHPVLNKTISRLLEECDDGGQVRKTAYRL